MTRKPHLRYVVQSLLLGLVPAEGSNDLLHGWLRIGVVTTPHLRVSDVPAHAYTDTPPQWARDVRKARSSSRAVERRFVAPWRHRRLRRLREQHGVMSAKTNTISRSRMGIDMAGKHVPSQPFQPPLGSIVDQSSICLVCHTQSKPNRCTSLLRLIAFWLVLPS